MKITTIKKSCPHCGKVYESYTANQYRNAKWGSPIRNCMACKNPFIDEEYIEPATMDEKESKPCWWKFSSAQKNLMLYLGLIVLCFNILLWKDGHFSLDGIYILASVLAGSYFLPMILKLIFHRWRIQKWEKAYSQSKERIADQHYVDIVYTLSKHKIVLNSSAKDITANHA